MNFGVKGDTAEKEGGQTLLFRRLFLRFWRAQAGNAEKGSIEY